jgi:hypothetical protein
MLLAELTRINNGDGSSYSRVFHFAPLVDQILLLYSFWLTTSDPDSDHFVDS